MSKSILIIETPKSCEECPCCKKDENYYGDILSAECQMKYKGYLKLTDEKPNWCPLKPMPTKYTSFVDAEDDSDEAIFEEIAENGERRGWNNCIDEILGGSHE